MTNYVEAMITKAVQAEKADEAMKFAQAAYNAANALAVMDSIQRMQLQVRKIPELLNQRHNHSNG